MKSVFVVFMVAYFAAAACGTSSPTTNLPTDSIMNSGQPAPDSPKLDSKLDSMHIKRDSTMK
jgi:hypothetical protein